jgi:hypothetical protein
MPDRREKLLGVFADADGLTRAVTAAVKGGFDELEALSPTPVPGLDDLIPERPSPVRWFALFGCIAGAIGGMAFQIMTVLMWPHITGGKPVVSLPAFVVVSFEMTILFGAITTLVGFAMATRLPQIGKDCYHEGCAQSDYALVVAYAPEDRAAVEALLRTAGAHEVLTAEPRSAWIETD